MKLLTLVMVEPLAILTYNYEIKSKFDLDDVSEIKRKFLRYKLNYEVGGDLKRGL